MKWTAKNIALCAVLAALALGLSTLEGLFPISLLVPLPGVKLGLANIVTVFALYQLGAGAALAIHLANCRPRRRTVSRMPPAKMRTISGTPQIKSSMATKMLFTVAKNCSTTLPFFIPHRETTDYLTPRAIRFRKAKEPVSIRR